MNIEKRFPNSVNVLFMSSAGKLLVLIAFLVL